MRLDKFLVECGIGSRKEVKKLISNDEITVNGSNDISAKDNIDENSDIIEYNGERLEYKEFRYYIMNKKAGYITATEDFKENTVMDLLPEWVIRKDLAPVGRLDKDTSGLILVAKNNYAHAKLASMFIDKTIHKTYLCIVKGNFSEENLSGRIENLIGRDSKDRKKMAVVKENGKIAISNYKVIEQVEGYSLVEVAIETGRTHQIRVHMKSINHVILGDSVYGTEDKNVKRQMLHAYKLEFLNPLDNKEYVFKGKLFNDFIEVAKKLKFNIEKYLNK